MAVEDYVAIRADILAEAMAAERRYGDYTSAHEAYGVLAEEMHELLAAIHANAAESVRHEAVQVAAVAMRFAESCRGNAPFARRSGFNVRR